MAFALAGCAVALGGCGGMPGNRSLDSTKQAVVERTTMALDLSTSFDGLPIAERQRLDGWFQAMNLRYGDRVAVNDSAGNPATRQAVAELAGRYGLLLSDAPAFAAGSAPAGQVRVVVVRSVASMPGCPDWSARSDINLANATYPNFGCAINGNLAAMVANPEDLIQGQAGTGETVVLTSTKAINSYREQAPTGTGGLKETSTSGGGN
ncbi:pilus assembly protein CpaD [Erythrobacteraceae bacterium CFH 75059]|nr:pilus assembly protein CpaD [Erythrobacteraceae bacterium CFH 75059]